MPLIRRLHTGLFAQAVRKPQRRQKLRAPVAADVEPLEDRTLLATFTVDNLGDVDDGVYTPGQQTLREAVDRSNTTAGPDIINFAGGGVIMLVNGELGVTEDVDINGPGTNVIRIDGNGASRIFNIATGVDVDINNLTLQNALADGSGGAILSDGSLVISNVAFNGNEASADGGAIALADMATSLTVDNSTFDGNEALGDGGAISGGNGTTLMISNTVFLANDGGTGGAIHHQGMLTLSDSFLFDNITQIAGGTITQELNGSTTLIERTEFDNNMAPTGGGFRMTAGTATILDSLFTNNQALFGPGGAISKGSGDLSVQRTTISGNSSLGMGGGIHSDGSSLTTTIIADSTIDNNFTDGLGGGISNLDSDLFIHNSTISGNIANRSGGGIMNEGGVIQITNVTVFNNRADADDDGFGISKGGGIFSPDDLIGTTTQLNNSIVVGNRLGAIGSDEANDIADEVSGSNNVIGSPAFSGGLLNGVNGNIVGDGIGGVLNPATVLDTVLSNNGGPTLTHVLISGSPAIDAGDTALAVDEQGQPLLTDQRQAGFFRLQDGDGNGVFAVDAGAVEVQGTGILVDTTSDGINGDLSPGDVSLREAVDLANMLPGPNEIYFAPFLAGQTILLTDGVITIDDDLTINGLGETVLTVSGGFNDTIFELNSGLTVLIRDLTLTQGNGILGGAIYNDGSDLTITNVRLFDNSADAGGGIYNDGGILEVRDSNLLFNFAFNEGGAIADVDGDVLITHSTIGNNQSGTGGGLWLQDSFATIINSTISTNFADSGPGGIFNDSLQTDIVNSTIVLNTGADFSAGGIETTNDSISLFNTIVAGNDDIFAVPNDILGLVDTQSAFNLIGDAATSGGLLDDDNGNIVGIGGSGTLDITTVIDTNLQFNGGSTMTHLLVAGSLAIDAGDDFEAVDEFFNPLLTDQRGGIFGRFRDGDDDGTPTVDIGAIERHGELFFVDTPVDESDGDFSQGDLSLREAIEQSNSLLGPAIILFDPLLTGQTIFLTMGELSITDDVEIHGLGKTSLTVSGNDASGVFSIADGLSVLIEDLTIAEGAAVDGAGIFHGDGDLTLNNVLFTGNDATDNGGALFNNGGVVMATGVMIQNNTAGIAGGGVENVGGDVFLNQSMVTGNTAGVSGGGAHNVGMARTFIDGTTVDGNMAGEEGGGLWNSASGILIVRNGSIVSGNTASGDAADQGGGGIFNDGNGPGAGGGRLAIQSGSTISGNVADGASGSGGGILTINGVVTIDDSFVTGNTANRAGGGIEFVTGIIELRNSALDGNSATGGGNGPGNGGGLHVTGLPGQVGFIRIFGGTVSNNIAASEGGGLWNNVANIMVVRQGAIVDGNRASGDAADNGGGGVFNNNGRLSIGEGAEITNNVADGAAGSGGGVFSTGGGLSIDSTLIAGNTAHRAGGGVEVIIGDAFLTNVIFLNNDAGGLTPNPGNGGAVHVSGAAFTRIDGAIVQGNTAAREGGGLWNSAGGVMLVRRSFTAAGPPTSTIEATGPNAPSIQVTVDAYRNLLGTLNANNPGTNGFGRREINWDGAPDSVATPNAFPSDFFNADVFPLARGVEFSTPGTGFQLSATAASGVGVNFSNINPTYATAFSTFSPERLFTPIGSNIVDVNFFVPGTSQPALVDGFGVVFTDVDVFGSTMVEYFDVDGNLIGMRTALATPGNGSQTFVGLTFQHNKIARVRITAGDGILGGGLDDITQGGVSDLVVMDDFIFGEPVPIGTLVDGNTASGNLSHDGGGGIFNNGGRVAIFESFITGNDADGDSGSGGGLFSLQFTTGAVTAKDTTFFGNTANRAGGGIEIVNGLMELTNTSLIGNQATGSGNGPGIGGGLHVSGTAARVTINGGTISGNFANREGGGLWNQSGSIMVLTGGTTIDTNTASGAAADDGGGGLFNNGGRVAITGATISNNIADGLNGSGGGILSIGGGVTLDNSTLSDNMAKGTGGGIRSNGDFVAANSTIVLNRSDADDALGGDGGGLFNGGTATLHNTIVAGNEMGTGGQTSDIAGNNLRTISRNNLIGDAGSSGGLADGVNGHIVGNGGAGVLAVFSIIDPLADNGGPTLTHALAIGSPAIDTGSNANAQDTNGIPFVTDQRGVGFPRINNGIVDIGAFED